MESEADLPEGFIQIGNDRRPGSNGRVVVASQGGNSSVFLYALEPHPIELCWYHLVDILYHDIEFDSELRMLMQSAGFVAEDNFDPTLEELNVYLGVRIAQQKWDVQ